MGVTELAKQLGCTKGLVSMLVKRGMPTTSVDAANAWRATNAPPRNRKDKREPIPAKPQDGQKVKSGGPYPPVAGSTPAPATPPPASPTPPDAPEPDDEDNTPRQSLRRARLAEKVGYNELVLCKRNGGSHEDIRKSNSTYIASRNNRIKAERDFRDWQRIESITLFLDEAREIYGRPHQAERQVLETMPKTLAARLVNQPQKSIESTLADWVDRLIELRRNSI